MHDWNLEKKKQLIKSAYAALPKGGAFIAVENLIDDARRENTFGLLMSLNMLIEFGDAFDFSGADFWEWCKEAGSIATKCFIWRVRAVRRSRTNSSDVNGLGHGNSASPDRTPNSMNNG